VLIEPELSNCGGWWVIQQIRAEQMACVVVALGRQANGGSLARLAGAESYVEMGTAPRDLLSSLELAMSFRRSAVSGSAEAEDDLLADANAMLDKPALVDF
jgi:hypothetical protein